MLRVHENIVFESQVVPGAYSVAVHTLGSHREVSVRPVVEWKESHELSPDCVLSRVRRGELEDPDQRQRELDARVRSARRARTRVRRLCKVMGLDTMLTLTYRSNVLDLAVCKAHVVRFRAALKYELAKYGGTFDYVLTYERQARGSWHVHIATHRIPACFRLGARVVKSYDLLRAVWRRVSGEFGGTCNVKRKRPGHSCGKLASYLAKYITKNADLVEPGDRRFQSSSCEVPRASRAEFVATSLLEMIELAYSLLDAPGAAVETSFVHRSGGAFFACGPPGLRKVLD